MRGDEHVGQRPQGRVGGQGLGGEHVQDRAGDAPVAEGVDQGRLVDHPAPADVDEDAARRQALDGRPVDQAGRLLGHGQAHHHGVGLAGQLGQALGAVDLVDPLGRRALGAPEPDRAHAKGLAQPGHLAPDLAQPEQEQGLAGQLPERAAGLGPDLGPLVLDQPGQLLGHGQQPEDGELGQRHRVDAAGGGDDDPLQGLGRQPGLADLLAGTGAGGVDPAQPGQAVDRLGQALGGVAGDAEQHLGPVQQGPPAGLALGVAFEGGVAEVVGRPAGRREQGWLVQHLGPRVGVLDPGRQLGLQRRGDQHLGTGHGGSGLPFDGRDDGGGDAAPPGRVGQRELAVQLLLDQRPDQPQPEPTLSDPPGTEGGRPLAVVVDLQDHRVVLAAAQLDRDRPVAVAQAVLDRVLDQLVQHHRQRGGHGRVDPHRGRVQLDVGVLAAQRAGQHLDDATGHVGHVHRALELLGQGLVDQGDRGDPAHRVLQGGHRLRVVAEPAGLEPEQGGDRLEVVLDPVVDLADGRLAPGDDPVAPAQLGRLPDQHQGPAAAGAPQQRDHPDVGDRAGGVDLGLDRAAAGHRLGDQDGRPVGERLAERQGIGAHPPEGRGGVGAGELDPAAGVEHDQAVPDPGRGRRVDGLHERERPDGHHLQQGLGRAQVGRLQPAGGAGRGLGRLDTEHGHDLALMADGHGLDPDRLGVDQDRLKRPLTPALPPGPLDIRVPGRLDHLADQVDRVEGAGGVGAQLADDAEALAALDGQEQQQVGEGEVGDQLPARHQAVEVLDRVVRQPAPDRRGNVTHGVSLAAPRPWVGWLGGGTRKP